MSEQDTNMETLKRYIAAIIFLSILWPICAQNNRTYRCHYFIRNFDNYKYKTDNIEGKRNKPSAFSLYAYPRIDTVFFYARINVRIQDGIRDEGIFFKEEKYGKEGKPGWYESTTEKVHDSFYKKVDKGYENSINVLTQMRERDHYLIPILFPEAKDTYSRLADTLSKTLKKEDIQNLKSNKIPVVYMNCDIDEKGRVIYWFLSSICPMHGIISDDTFSKIATIMRKVRFPKTKGLKQKFLYDDGTNMRIYTEIENDKWNDIMFRKKQ